jgi:hypothetical protein
MRRNALRLLRPTLSIPELDTYAMLLAGLGLMGFGALSKTERSRYFFVWAM